MSFLDQQEEQFPLEKIFLKNDESKLWKHNWSWFNLTVDNCFISLVVTGRLRINHPAY